MPVLVVVGGGLIGVLVHTLRTRILTPNKRVWMQHRARVLALDDERQHAEATGAWRPGLREELAELDRFPGEEDALEDEREASEERDRRGRRS